MPCPCGARCKQLVASAVLRPAVVLLRRRRAVLHGAHSVGQHGAVHLPAAVRRCTGILISLSLYVLLFGPVCILPAAVRRRAGALVLSMFCFVQLKPFVCVFQQQYGIAQVRRRDLIVSCSSMGPCTAVPLPVMCVCSSCARPRRHALALIVPCSCGWRDCGSHTRACRLAKALQVDTAGCRHHPAAAPPLAPMCPFAHLPPCNAFPC